MSSITLEPAVESVTVALCGPPEWSRDMRRYAVESGFGSWRYVDAPRDDRDDETGLPAIDDGVDAVLFDGRFYHDEALARGALTIPAAYVHIGSTFVFPTLLAAQRAGTHDIDRVSIDSVDADQVRDVYASFGASAEQVRAINDNSRRCVQAYVEFHTGLFDAGLVSGALTSMSTVERSLRKAGVPVARMRPPVSQQKESLRQALTTLAALVSGSRAQLSHLVVAIVSLAPSARPSSPWESSSWRQELSLELHKILLEEARAISGTVAARSPADFTVTSTLGDLHRVTGRLRRAPFLGRIQAQLGVEVDVGIGLGDSAREADDNALAGVERARLLDGCAAIVVTPNGSGISLPVRPTPPARRAADSRTLAFLRRVVDGLPTEAGVPTPLVVDVETVARAIAMAPSNVRRNMEGLVRDGLAWPTQAPPSAKGGRPKYVYRLVTEKL